MTKHATLVGLLLALSNAVAMAAPLIDGNVEAGRKLAAQCAGCHGLDGNSSSAKFPKLAGQHATYIYQQLQLFKSGQRKNAIMNSMASGLSKQEMKNLAVYYASQEIKPSLVPNVDLAQLGAKIYHGGLSEFDVPACSGCHGPSGLGNPAAVYPRISGQHAEYIAAELRAYRTGKRGGYPRAEIMEGVTRGLSNHQIKALAAYITGLMPAKPTHDNDSGALLEDPPEPADEQGSPDEPT